MAESRKLTTIVAADVVGYSRLAAIDEERTVARLRALRGDLIDPAIAAHHGRIVKRTGDGTLMEFRSVVDAVRCAIEVQNGMVERNAGLPPERQIQFRVGVHLGDVIEEADGDLMGDGVNIAARLESICEPGAICLSEDAYRHVRARLDLAVTDLGNRELKNIPEPVHAFSLEVGKPAVAIPAAAAPANRGTPANKVTTPANAGAHRADAATSTTMDPRVRGGGRKGSGLIAVGIAALLVIAAVASWYFLARPGARIAANAPAHLSIVVLPFQNLSGDPKQDYFADGITDNLTTDLSRIRNSFVIARNTAFTYKGKAVDAKEIGKELGVRYVLEGSVARDGNRVRVNAQLIDAESGSHLWADRFEEDLADLFKLQDDVVARLANTLGYELVKAEAAKSAHSANPDAIDLTMQGWALLNAAGRDKTRHGAARALFERALALDPQDAEAMTGIALIDSRGFIYGWLANPDPDLHAQLDLVGKAISINPDYAFAYYVKSSALFFAKRFGEAVEAGRQGVNADPNSAFSYFAMGQAEHPLGLCQQSIEHTRKAFQLSPRDPGGGVWHMNLGLGEMCLGHIDSAIDEYKRAIDGGFRAYIAYVNLASAQALKGDDADAKAALTEARRIIPQLTVKWIVAHSPTTPAMLEGLRLAGLPEDEPPPPPKHLSIVVLPFDNLSGDPKQDYFADGITDNLTTDLSRIRNSFVIARNTAFTYKGKAVDAKAIGKDLGVRYVLEGSVARDGNRVRVNAQLIDAESGSHLWADRFEEDLADLFKLQDDVVARLANTLGYELVKAEAARSVRSTNPDAIDLSMQGWAAIWQPPTKESTTAARDFFARALKMEPDNGEAMVGLAYSIARTSVLGLHLDKADVVEAMNLLARNPDNAFGWYAKSFLLFLDHRFSDAVQAAEKSAALNPNLAFAHFGMAQAEWPLGQCERAITHMKEAFQLSPRDPGAGIWHFNVGNAQFCLGNMDAAIAEYRTTVDGGYRTWFAYAYLAAALGLRGDDLEAKAALAEAMRLVPNLTIKWTAAHGVASERHLEGLRKLGVPEDDGPRLSIVVLPFQNLSGDAKQDYLADVLSDELTTYISRIPGSFVIARNTAFTYKGKPTDAKAIGKELGVRYMLEGSVQPTDKRIRTNAQLIDSETGAHLWAEQFDTDKTDLLETEDEIVTRLAHALQIQMTDIEAARLQRVHPANENAEDLALQCQARGLAAGFIGLDADAAYRLCQQALDADPNNVRALALLSEKFWLPVTMGHSANPQDDLSKADAMVSRALSIDPNYARAHYAKSGVLLGRRQFDEMILEDERVISLDPSSVEGYGAIGNALWGQGHYEKAIAYFGKAVRLSPNDPRIFYWYAGIAGCDFALEQYERTIDAARKAVASNPNFSPIYVTLAAALALTGRQDEARDIVRRHNAMDTPLKSIVSIKKSSALPIQMSYWPRLEEGLRKAGMPEQ